MAIVEKDTLVTIKQFKKSVITLPRFGLGGMH